MKVVSTTPRDVNQITSEIDNLISQHRQFFDEWRDSFTSQSKMIVKREENAAVRQIFEDISAVDG